MRREGALLFAACLASGAGALFFNVMPLFLGAAAESFGLDDARLGWIGSSYLAGFAIVAATAPLWTRRLDWRQTAMAASAAAVGGIAACAVVSDYAGLLVAVFLAGMGSGVLFTVAIAIVSESRHLERAFGFKLVAETAPGVLLLLVLPPIVLGRWGFAGAALVIAASIAVCAALSVPRLPSGSRAQADDAEPLTTTARAGVAPWVGLGALLLHFGAITALWAFLERVASDFGVDTLLASRILIASMALNVVSALSAAAMGGRFGRSFPLATGMVAMLGGVAALMLRPDVYGYAAGALLLNGLWSLVICFQCSVIAAADRTKRVAVLIPTALTCGGAIGPALAGSLAVAGGYAPIYVLCGVATSVSLGAFVGIEWWRKRARTDAHRQTVPASTPGT